MKYLYFSVCLTIIAYSIQSDRFILELENQNDLPILNIQIGENTINKSVLISTNSKNSWIYSDENIVNIHENVYIYINLDRFTWNKGYV